MQDICKVFVTHNACNWAQLRYEQGIDFDSLAQLSADLDLVKPGYLRSYHDHVERVRALVISDEERSLPIAGAFSVFAPREIGPIFVNVTLAYDRRVAYYAL